MAKKAYMVMARDPKVLETGLTTGKGKLKFKKGQNSMMIGDEALANEVDQIQGLKGSGDVWVHEDQRAESFLRDEGREGAGVHRYFWGASPKYHNAWIEFEKRRKDKKVKHEKNAQS